MISALPMAANIALTASWIVCVPVITPWAELATLLVMASNAAAVAVAAQADKQREELNDIKIKAQAKLAGTTALHLKAE